MKIDPNKTILDACCGGRMFYFDKHNPNVLYQDIRNQTEILCNGREFEVKPDVVADFTNMPYDDETFSMVIFDPPHLVYGRGKKSKPTGYMPLKYGVVRSDWREVLRKGFSECFRVLRRGGVPRL